MPKVKRNNSVIHPNSRKASQLARKVHHDEKLERRNKELHLKQKAKLLKMKWFKDNIDTTKEVYSIADVKELVNKYLNRFVENEEKQTEVKTLKRHISDSTFVDFKTKFLIQKEKQELKLGGLEVPQLMQKNSFSIFKSWNGDVQLLPAIDTVKITQRQLEIIK